MLIVCPHARILSRGEGVVLLGAQVVGVEVEHADHEGQEHQDEDDHELHDVLHRAAQRDLQRAEALVGRQDVGDPGEAEHHRHCVQPLGDQLGVGGQPVRPRCEGNPLVTTTLSCITKAQRFRFLFFKKNPGIYQCLF